MFPAIYHFLRSFFFDEKAFGRWALAVLSTGAYITGQYSQELAAASQPWVGTAVDYVCGGIVAASGAAGTGALKSAFAAARNGNGTPPAGDP